MSAPHTAEYFRARRATIARLAGRPMRGDYTQTPAALRRGAELRQMEQLPMLSWPANLFGRAKRIDRSD